MQKDVKEVKIEYKRKEFDIDKKLNIPKNIFHYKSKDDVHLFIAPEKATYLSSNNIGRLILDYFKNGFNIRQVVDELKLKGINSDKITNELRELLIKIEKRGFYEDADVKEAETEKTLQLYLTNKCNLRCIHCYLDAGESKKNELKTNEWGKIIDEFSSVRKSRITFTGGEPLLRHDIFTLAERAKKKGQTVEIFTNGTLINDQMVNKLSKCVHIIQLSLDGATENVNDKIRSKGCFKKVINAINLLKKTDILIRLAITVIPQNIDDLKTNIENLVSSLPTEVEIKFGFATIEGRANKSFRFPDNAVAEDELEKVLKIIYENRLKGMRKITPNLKSLNCGYGETITVNSDGNVYPCALPQYGAGNIKDKNMKEIIKKFDEERFLSNVDNLEKCSQCEVRYFCNGGCRLNFITYNKSLFKPHCPPGRKQTFYEQLISRDRFDALSFWINSKNDLKKI